MAEKFVPLLVASDTLAFAFRGKATDLAVTVLGCGALMRGAMIGFGGSPGEAWVFGMAFAGLVIKTYNWRYIVSADKLVRKDAKDRSPSKDGARISSANNNILEPFGRIWTALQMVLSSRGIGWGFELRGLPQLPDDDISRKKFAIQQAGGVIWRYLVLDLGRHLLLSTKLAGEGPLNGPMDYPFVVQLLLGAVLWQWVRWKMDMPYRIASIVGVLVGWGKPKDWPPYFGSWGDSWTIRRLWAKSWHQSLRLQTEPPVNWLFEKVLRAKRDSYLNKYGRVVGIFFMAFVVHAYARILAGGNVMIDWKYFMTQPIIIAFEDAVQHLAARLGVVPSSHWLCRAIGYLWTCGVSTWTLAYWADEIIRKGLFTDLIFGFTVAGRILPS